MSARWHVLLRELDAWRALGRRATLWWRDDDACRDSAALRRLLGIARAECVPVGVAAIPMACEATLVDAISACDQATIVQHGYAHRNHAPAGERSAEIGAHRALRARLEELEGGREALSRLFGARFRPLLVPPWNRVAADVVPALPSIGLSGISCFGPRAARWPAHGVQQANTHVDLIAWRRDRRFIGTDAAVERVTAHLQARRRAEVDVEEPTGLLTHHLAFGDDAFHFTAELCARTRDHPAAAWLDVDAVFDPMALASLPADQHEAHVATHLPLAGK
jgi:hypothetical protein